MTQSLTTDPPGIYEQIIVTAGPPRMCEKSGIKIDPLGTLKHAVMIANPIGSQK